MAVLGSYYLVSRCDPLPTELMKQEKRAEIEPDWKAEKHKKGVSTAR